MKTLQKDGIPMCSIIIIALHSRKLNISLK
jgi:hypothetical protein